VRAVISRAFVLLVSLLLCVPSPGAGDARKRPAPPGVVGNVIVGYYDPYAPLADGAFYFHDLGHRCIDFGGRDFWRLGGPVQIYSCNGTVAQQVRVKELDGSHDVELRAQSLFCIGVKGGEVAVGQPLELQACNGSAAQRFALDGDSVLMGTQSGGRVSREFAIQPDQKRTVNRTPLVVAARELSDAEYFRYEAVDHSAIKPTNGFLAVSSEAGLDWALGLGWGTVIEVDDRSSLILTRTPKAIHEGVTLRGYRKYTYQGPEIRTCVAEAGGRAFSIAEPQARMTGLRLRGQTVDPQCSGDLGNDSSAIGVDTNGFLDTSSVWVDHLDIGYWHGHAIDVRGGVQLTQDCPSQIPPFPRNPSVRAIGNFVHHNTNYGIVTGQAAFVLVQGNVFYRQGAHSIASDPVNLSGYAAYDNLILQDTPHHDIDMHGSMHPGHWYDGISGDYFDVGWNTILPTEHENVNVRGTPCRAVRIHDNVFIQSKSDAIASRSTKPLAFWDNQFGASPHLMLDLAVGDFDGDGIDDVFVGTGAAWYFSSGGAAEWRFLNRMREHASALRFGDFDGDGRTDIIAIHGAHIDISWGGISPWQTINVVAWPITDIAIGDFDGDGIADLFLATGAQWFYAPGGRNWTPFASSSVRTKDLRFGDFTHSGHTQVLRISASHEWQIVRHVGGMWESLGSAGDAYLPGLVVGDFDGDGFADLAHIHNDRWEYVSPGAGIGWRELWNYTGELVGQPIGRFDADRTSDVIEWAGRNFYYAPGGKGPLVRLSRQDMK
jgi:ricin-type beta-trefoil lectin protein/VCBS repeat protein